MSEEQTVITLQDDEAALIIGPEKLDVFVPGQDGEEIVPDYVLLLVGVAAMLSDEDLSAELLEGVTKALESLDEMGEAGG
jgi:hypothetical protein